MFSFHLGINQPLISASTARFLCIINPITVLSAYCGSLRPSHKGFIFNWIQLSLNYASFMNSVVFISWLCLIFSNESILCYRKENLLVLETVKVRSHLELLKHDKEDLTRPGIKKSHWKAWKALPCTLPLKDMIWIKWTSESFAILINLLASEWWITGIMTM